MRLAMEKDLETVRQAALLLEAENRKLVAKNLELQTELLKLEGLGVEQLALRLAELEQQLATRNKMLFGPSSEKRHKRSKEGTAESSQKGHGPKEQPELRIVEQPVELGDVAQTCCPHCNGTVTEWVGQFEESEEIDVISREFVRKTIRRKKARCECNRTIVTAPVPAKLFPAARYSIAFGAHVVVSKYVDHLPLERQVKMMKRDGLDVESQTLWDYTWAMAQLLKPAHERLLQYVLDKPVVGADETWWRLMGAKSKRDGGDGAKWWVWCVGADDAVCYRLEDSRSAQAASRLLGEYTGTVMCDGYSSYISLAKSRRQFQLAHCWSHVRRKFFELESAFATESKQVLDLIDELFRIETLCVTGPPGDETRAQLRADKSRPIVKQIEQWALSVQALPESGLRKAIEYMGNMWRGLVLFLDDPAVPLHNNASERALRGPVIGRVNHFGSRSRRGTEAAAILYSLVASAKRAGTEPAAYLDLAARAALGGGVIPLPHEAAVAL